MDWLSLPVDVKGTIYEELLSRSAQESSKGARVELLTGIEGASSRPVRKIVVLEG